MDDGLDHRTCIFPTLTDGYIRDCNYGTQKNHHIDLTHLSRALTAGFPAKARKVSPQVVIVGAWAITAAKYIGTDHVSFRVILNSAFRRDALVCDLFSDESETQLEFLCRVEDQVGDDSPQAVRLDELGTAETCAGFLGNFSNMCLVYEDGSGIVAPPLIDYVRKQVRIGRSPTSLGAGGDRWLTLYISLICLSLSPGRRATAELLDCRGECRCLSQGLS